MSIVWDESNGGFWQNSDQNLGIYEEGTLETSWDELMNLGIGETVNIRLKQDPKYGDGKAILKYRIIGFWTAKNMVSALRNMNHPYLIIAGFSPNFKVNDVNLLTDEERENLVEIIVYQGHDQDSGFKVISTERYDSKIC